jgi:hypothetical protein
LKAHVERMSSDRIPHVTFVMMEDCFVISVTGLNTAGTGKEDDGDDPPPLSN